MNDVSEGATVAPVIISTDKTQLTQFVGGKSAYPVYLTIGNIPKSIRRQPSQHACLLIAYLSVDKINRSAMYMSDQEHRIRVQRIFHEAMRVVLEPLIAAGRNGVEMISSDGSVRNVFPILTCYAADYPEQCLVSCSKYGTCVKCRAKATDLGNSQQAQPRTAEWTISIIHGALSTSLPYSEATKRSRVFHTECMSQDVAGTVHRPFWASLPLCDIHKAITPDVLHQLYQGVFKHLITWCQKAVGAARLDARIRTLPPTYGVRHFKNGISRLSQVSGGERKNMAKILLGCLVGIMPKAGILAVTALLDFIYIAQYSAHNKVTLGYLEDALDRFNKHRDYFIKIGIREDFNVPKFHSLIHYTDAIKAFGTTDNYNTELFERLHIDFAKEGWRASNHRDEFPQMIKWLSRHEKISCFELHLSRFPDLTSTQSATPPQPDINATRSENQISIAKHPSYPKSPIALVMSRHSAPDFEHYLKVYINGFQEKPMKIQELEHHSLSFTRVHVFNQCYLHSALIHDDDSVSPDIVRALRKSKTHPSGRFDTVVALTDKDAESTGLTGQYFFCTKTKEYVSNI